MSMTGLEYLFRVEAPFIFVGAGEGERGDWNPTHFYSSPGVGVCVRQLRGQKMRTTADLMNEFGAALQFFDGFGENWHALQECLSYLDEWLPADAYVLVVEHAEEVLAEQDEELPSLLKTVGLAAEFWSNPVADNGRFNRPSVPFHLLLNVSDGTDRSIRRFVEAASAASVGIRVGSSDAGPGGP